MPRQSGSVSAGYVAPPPPTPSDNMVFNTTATANAYQAGTFLNISANRVPVVFDLTPNDVLFLPTNGIFTDMIVQLNTPVVLGDFVLILYDNGVPTGVEALITAGNTSADLSGLTVPGIRGDAYAWYLADISDTLSFSASLNFVPS